MDVAFLALGSSPDQIRLEKAIIDSAVAAELPHLVKLSTIATGHDSALSVGRLHAEIQDHLVSSGLAYTLLRSASYVNNLFYAAKSVVTQNNWSGAAPTGRVAYIDIRDLSEAAAPLVLREPALHGKTYDLSGPDAYTFPQIAGLLSRILRHEVTYIPVSPGERRSALLGSGVSEWFTERLLSQPGDQRRSRPARNGHHHVEGTARPRAADRRAVPHRERGPLQELSWRRGLFGCAAEAANRRRVWLRGLRFRRGQRRQAPGWCSRGL